MPRDAEGIQPSRVRGCLRGLEPDAGPSIEKTLDVTRQTKRCRVVQAAPPACVHRVQLALSAQARHELRVGVIDHELLCVPAHPREQIPIDATSPPPASSRADGWSALARAARQQRRHRQLRSTPADHHIDRDRDYTILFI
jgi:hypothetical protein